ncbi:hypothetical protein GCM10010353_68090 [Streptomyces chryseus]|nr:hypothetical protein GCM10010353_68090 [Streptomyces chryseus]
MVDVDDRLQHQEQHVAVALQLGPLMRMDGVLDRERVQPERPGTLLQLLLARLVQADLPNRPA